MALLEGKGVSKYFGGLAAVDNVDFELKKGEILGLIGPNGSGKTTLFNVITGFYKPTSGIIKYKEEDITGKRPDTICKMGIARTFQLTKPFGSLTVLENLLTGAIFGKSGEKLNFFREDTSELKEECLKILEFFELSNKRNKQISDLTLGDLRQLEIARALVTNPDVLLLDEVVVGLVPTEIEILTKRIAQINRNMGVTMMMVEHVMQAVMSVSGRIIVLDSGQKIAEGTPEEVANDKKVIEAYMGE